MGQTLSPDELLQITALYSTYHMEYSRCMEKESCSVISSWIFHSDHSGGAGPFFFKQVFLIRWPSKFFISNNLNEIWTQGSWINFEFWVDWFVGILIWFPNFCRRHQKSKEIFQKIIFFFRNLCAGRMPSRVSIRRSRTMHKWKASTGEGDVWIVFSPFYYVPDEVI